MTEFDPDKAILLSDPRYRLLNPETTLQPPLAVGTETAVSIIAYSYAVLIQDEELRQKFLLTDQPDAAVHAERVFQENLDSLLERSLKQALAARFQASASDSVRKEKTDLKDKLIKTFPFIPMVENQASFTHGLLWETNQESQDAINRMLAVGLLDLRERLIDEAKSDPNRIRDIEQVLASNILSLEAALAQTQVHLGRLMLVFEQLERLITTGQDSLVTYVNKDVNTVWNELGNKAWVFPPPLSVWDWVKQWDNLVKSQHNLLLFRNNLAGYLRQKYASTYCAALKQRLLILRLGREDFYTLYKQRGEEWIAAKADEVYQAVKSGQMPPPDGITLQEVLGLSVRSVEYIGQAEETDRTARDLIAKKSKEIQRLKSELKAYEEAHADTDPVLETEIEFLQVEMAMAQKRVQTFEEMRNRVERGCDGVDPVVPEGPVNRQKWADFLEQEATHSSSKALPPVAHNAWQAFWAAFESSMSQDVVSQGLRTILACVVDSDTFAQQRHLSLRNLLQRVDEAVRSRLTALISRRQIDATLAYLFSSPNHLEVCSLLLDTPDDALFLYDQPHDFILGTSQINQPSHQYQGQNRYGLFLGRVHRSLKEMFRTSEQYRWVMARMTEVMDSLQRFLKYKRMSELSRSDMLTGDTVKFILGLFYPGDVLDELLQTPDQMAPRLKDQFFQEWLRTQFHGVYITTPAVENLWKLLQFLRHQSDRGPQDNQSIADWDAEQSSILRRHLLLTGACDDQPQCIRASFTGLLEQVQAWRAQQLARSAGDNPFGDAIQRLKRYWKTNRALLENRATSEFETIRTIEQDFVSRMTEQNQLFNSLKVDIAQQVSSAEQPAVLEQLEAQLKAEKDTLLARRADALSALDQSQDFTRVLIDQLVRFAPAVQQSTGLDQIRDQFLAERVIRIQQLEVLAATLSERDEQPIREKLIKETLAQFTAEKFLEEIKDAVIEPAFDHEVDKRLTKKLLELKLTYDKRSLSIPTSDATKRQLKEDIELALLSEHRQKPAAYQPQVAKYLERLTLLQQTPPYLDHQLESDASGGCPLPPVISGAEKNRRLAQRAEVLGRDAFAYAKWSEDSSQDDLQFVFEMLCAQLQPEHPVTFQEYRKEHPGLPLDSIDSMIRALSTVVTDSWAVSRILIFQK